MIDTNDVLAVDAIVAFREAGVRIPEDISITAFDDTDLGATQTPCPRNEHPCRLAACRA